MSRSWNQDDYEDSEMEEEYEEPKVQLSKEERRWFILGALKSTLLIGSVYLIGAALLIWFLLTIWN